MSCYDTFYDDLHLNESNNTPSIHKLSLPSNERQYLHLPQPASSSTVASPAATGTPVSSIPQKYRSLFKFTHFNGVQSRVLEQILHGDDNAVISAPTGSGKTAIMELAIIAELQRQTPGKIVYIAPVRALCSERFNDWKTKFKTLGVEVGEFTGDTETISLNDLRKAQILITTPEKWDSITRSWKSRQSVMDTVRLLLLDEVHMVNDLRGATLEVVVSRMKTRIQEKIRIIGISATIPNIQDIGEWFSFGGSERVNVQQFGSEFRPVPLTTHVVGFTSGYKENNFQFEKSLETHLYDLYEKYSEQMPTLIFCGTRKGTESALSSLLKQVKGVKVQPGTNQHPFVQNHKQKEELANAALKVYNKELCPFLDQGLAFHHGGLSASDRKIVENLFLKTCIKILCTTSTLACGVNLPAHLVIVKSTRVYNDGKFENLSSMDLLQMVGRAGRPQFDTHGIAVVMCEHGEVGRLERVLNGAELVSSKLDSRLIEHVNAEIGLGTITDIKSAINWIKSTFLYVCKKQNPQALEECLERALELLEKSDLISKQNSRLKQTPSGATMSKYYVKYESMKLISHMAREQSQRDILDLISRCDEFSEMRFESGEREKLNKANKDVKYPLDNRVSTAAHKAFILIQVRLGRLKAHEGTFVRVLDSTLRTATRLVKCVISNALQHKDTKTLVNSLLLSSQLNIGLWDEDLLSLHQIDKIGPVYAQKLYAAGYKNIKQLLNADPRTVETVCQKKPPFGNDVISCVNSYPNLSISIAKIDRLPAVPNTTELLVSISNEAIPSQKRAKKDYSNFITIVAYTSDESFVDFRSTSPENLAKGAEINFQIPSLVQFFRIHAICGFCIGGFNCVEQIEFNQVPVTPIKGTKGAINLQDFIYRGNKEKDAADSSKTNNREEAQFNIPTFTPTDQPDEGERKPAGESGNKKRVRIKKAPVNKWGSKQKVSTAKEPPTPSASPISFDLTATEVTQVPEAKVAASKRTNKEKRVIVEGFKDGSDCKSENGLPPTDYFIDPSKSTKTVGECETVFMQMFGI